MDEWVNIDDEGWIDIRPVYTSGIATTFGYNDSGDSGVGAWGTPTNNPDLVGVSLPRKVLAEQFGDENKAKGAMVEVVNPASGKKIVAPIVDKGPADWVIERQGPTIDLTEGARKALASASKTPMQWRFIGGQPTQEKTASIPTGGQVRAGEAIAPTTTLASNVDQGWVDVKDISHGQEVPQAAAASPSPMGSVSPTYLPEEDIKGKMVKLRTTDPTSGEAFVEETDAATAQSFIKGNIDTYTTLMDCLSKS